MNTETAGTDAGVIERRSLAFAKWGNLFMGCAGVTAAFASNSEAILLDGLYSGVGFISAIVAARVGKRVSQAPDRQRPFGYDADEAIYTTFRSLSLLGLILFAVFSAGSKIVTYLTGGDVPELIFGPIIIYFVVICATCLGLTLLHRYNWRRTGKRSDILKLEANAATVDGVITGAAGLGLLGIPLLADTPLAVIIPVGDAIILLILCVLIIANPVVSFRKGLAELAGISAAPDKLKALRRLARSAAEDAGLRLVDASISKLGRTYTAAVYVDPNAPVGADVIDALAARLQAEAADAIGPTRVYVIVSRHGRAGAAGSLGRETAAP